MARAIRILKELIRHSTVITSFLLILYLLVFQLLLFFIPDSDAVGPEFLYMPNVRYTMFLAFFLLFIGWIVSYRQKLVSIINPFKYAKEEFITLCITSFLFAVFMTKTFIPYKIPNSFYLLVYTVVFIALLPQAINIYTTYTKPTPHTVKGGLRKQLGIKLSFDRKSYFPMVVVSLLLCYSIALTIFFTKLHSDTQKVFQKDLFITKVAPQSTTYGYDVTLIGYNFGGIPDEQYKLLSNSGQVTTTYWSNNKIMFTIPLHWKDGKIDLWVERPDKEHTDYIAISNIVSIDLLNRWDFYPTEQDDFYIRGLKKIVRIVYLDYWNKLSLLLP